MSSQTKVVEEGLLATALPYRAVGAGQTLLYFPPFAPYHELTTGFSRTIELNILRRFAAGGFRVYQVNRRPGLATGTTMHDLAADYARAIEQHFSQPVDILGFSTGGAIALNFAAEYPHLLRRLVLASAAHRLSPVAWNASKQAAERAEARDRRGFQMAMAPAAALSKPAQMAAAAFGWLLAPLTLKRDWNPSDAVITLRADMSIDVDSRLSTISTPTLIVCGDSDPSYPLAITAELTQKLPNARRIVYPRTGHGVVLHKRFVTDLVEFLTPDPTKGTADDAD
ncbi:MAG: alpha/beta fold hydrolase [Caldilineaceae bacterium]